MSWQGDLFDDVLGAEGIGIARPRRKSPARRSPTPGSRAYAPETAARILEASDDYRVLRRLRPRAIAPPRALEAGERLTIILDTETTGLDHRHDEVIELGMVAFIHDEAGTVMDVVGVLSAFQEPSRPIGAAITRLTGITDAMVAGQRIDLEAVEAFIAEADLIIAHNAGFDRPFCERLARGFAPKPWACSVKEVPWATFGYEGSKLGYLVGQAGWFHTGHRAADDCHALLEVLAAPLPNGTGTALGHLLACSAKAGVRIWAEGAPFDFKDALKRRGYRWSDGGDGRPRAWWIELDEALAEAEVIYLQTEIYLRQVRPRTQRVDACERYRPA